MVREICSSWMTHSKQKVGPFKQTSQFITSRLLDNHPHWCGIVIKALISPIASNSCIKLILIGFSRGSIVYTKTHLFKGHYRKQAYKEFYHANVFTHRALIIALNDHYYCIKSINLGGNQNCVFLTASREAPEVISLIGMHSFMRLL